LEEMGMHALERAGRCDRRTEWRIEITIRLPTGGLTGYIGIVEGKVPKEFHLSRVVTFPKKTA
jgi:hypothetical protein